jgi:hypothetical protein
MEALGSRLFVSASHLLPFATAMKKLLPFLIGLTGLVHPASAQQLIPPPQHQYLDSLFEVLPSSVGAHYRREITYTDSTGGVMRDYYLSGQLQSSGTFDHVRRFSVHGVLETWYEAGPFILLGNSNGWSTIPMRVRSER